VAGGHPNVYLYCANDPVNAKDPSGLSQDDDEALDQTFEGTGLRADQMGNRPTPGRGRAQKATSQAKSVAQFTIELIPIEQYRKAISGKDCWNQSVSGGERIFIFAAASTGGIGKGGQGFWNGLKRLFGFGKKSKSSKTQVNPLTGIAYDERVLEATRGQVLNPYPDYHAFPAIVDNSAHLATVTKIVVNGKTKTLIQLSGAYRGRDGVFEWVVDENNICYHRLFRPN
jgi:hypothetical protein